MVMRAATPPPTFWAGGLKEVGDHVFFNIALAENALPPTEFRKSSPSSLGRKKATQRNRASHCSVDLRGCRTNYRSCAKNNFVEVVHGYGVVAYPTQQCAKR
jgi:hypothetical protein